jgi:hypothetical protein
VSRLHHQFDRPLLTRAAALVSILVLVSVPALTRVGQKLDPRSHGPSFSRNIDCPPKKVSVAPVIAGAPRTAPVVVSTTVTNVTLSVDPIVPPQPGLALRPLRAPPSAVLA